MDVTFRRLSQSGQGGYELERLRLMAKPQGADGFVVAHGFYLEPEILVLRDSQMFAYTAPELEHPDARDLQELRDSLIGGGMLVRHGPIYVFQRDYVFHSASLAAMVILGQFADGLDMWRNIQGTKLADLLATRLPV